MDTKIIKTPNPTIPLFAHLIKQSTRMGWDFATERYEFWLSSSQGDIKIMELYDFFVYAWMKRHLPPIQNGTWYGIIISKGKAEFDEFPSCDS